MQTEFRRKGTILDHGYMNLVCENLKILNLYLHRMQTEVCWKGNFTVDKSFTMWKSCYPSGRCLFSTFFCAHEKWIYITKGIIILCGVSTFGILELKSDQKSPALKVNALKSVQSLKIEVLDISILEYLKPGLSILAVLKTGELPAWLGPVKMAQGKGSVTKFAAFRFPHVNYFYSQ